MLILCYSYKHLWWWTKSTGIGCVALPTGPVFGKPELYSTHIPKRSPLKFYNGVSCAGRSGWLDGWLVGCVVAR